MLTKEINSLQHPIVKTFVKLRSSRKFRYEQKYLVISGIKQIQEAAAVEILFVKKGFIPPCKAKEIYHVTDEVLKKTSGLETPEPVVAMIAMPTWASLKGKNWILGLDGISDPGNLGTLLRTALALGWEGAFLSDTCVDPFNDKSIRSAKGATFSLPLKMGSHDEMLSFIQEEKLPTWIADMDGEPLSQIKSPPRALLILGNEAHGVDPKLKGAFPKLSIPISQIESLNVAAAGAILMYNLIT